MTTISVPDGTHYVVAYCLPSGEQTKVECRSSDGLDVNAAIVLMEFGKAELLQRKQAADVEAGRQRLTLPVVAKAVALPMLDAETPMVAELAANGTRGNGKRG